MQRKRHFAAITIRLATICAAVLVAIRMSAASAATSGQKTILYGAAYYEEYAPDDRLRADIEMMKAAGVNVIRIGESTWGTLEPHNGRFDYSHIDRVIKAMDAAGLRVIMGTPTYAIPT